MKAAIAFVKQYIFAIGCGVVVVASIGLGAWGLSKMSEVSTEMEKVKALYGQFAGVSRSPANHLSIEAEKRRVETVKEHYAALTERAHAINQYPLLTPPEGERFFPTPTRDGLLDFEKIYKAAFDEMLLELGACGPPGTLEIEREEEIIREEKRAEASFNLDPDEQESGSSDETGPQRRPSGLITAAGAVESAATRASIRIAKRCRIYADRGAFEIFSGMFANLSPNVRDMWAAQVSLMLQKDIVSSIARINENAVRELRAAGGKAWVGVMPVKELISIRTSGYLPSDAPIRPMESRLTGSTAAAPAGTGADVFTKTTSGDLYEAVQFTVKLVVDVRDLEVIIDELCKDKFHTVVNVGYVYDGGYLENLDMSGKIFGSEPTAIVVLDFDTIMFGDIFRRIMPDEILSRLGQKRPEDKAS